MFTPDDLMNITFSRAGKNTYRSDEVDEFVNFAQTLIRQMTIEKKELDKKIIILAEKIEEYRKDEDSLRAALLGAQRFGDNIVKEAKAKADAILKEANLKAEFTKSDIEKQIENSKLELSQMKSEVSSFRGRMLSSYKTHIEMISSLPNFQDEQNLQDLSGSSKDSTTILDEK